MLHLSFSSPAQHMCEASTFWDFPSCWSRWCQLTPRCAGHSFIRWYDLLENNTAGQAQHMCRINLARRECGKVSGFETATCCRTPGPWPVSVQHQLTWEGESNTLAEATVSNLTTKKKNYNSEWHNADPLMAEKTQSVGEKEFRPDTFAQVWQSRLMYLVSKSSRVWK